VSPVLSGLSTGLTAGIAKEGLGAINPELKAKIFPEQQTLPGKGLRFASEAVGTLAGLPAKATLTGAKLIGQGATAASKVLPKFLGRIVNNPLTKTAAIGAVGGASVAPKDLSGKQYGENIKTGAAFGAVAPVAGKALEKTVGGGALFISVLSTKFMSFALSRF